MDIREWLKNKEKKERLLITENLSYGRELIASAGFPVFGIKVMTIPEAAKNIVSYDLAMKGRTVRMISREYASSLLRKVLLEHAGELSYYNEPELLDQAGADEIYRILGIVRNNECDLSSVNMSRIQKEDHPRIHDLFLIRDLFEKEMNQKEVMDPAGVLHYAADAVQAMREDPGFFAETGILSSEQKYFSYDEKRLTEGIAAVSGGKGEPEILDLPSSFSTYLNGIMPADVEMSFGKGFGYANEVKHAVYDILHNGHPYGETCILYASGAMEPWITSELETAGIPFVFEDGRTLSGNRLICLIRAMIRWASGGFLLQDFKNVLSNSLLDFDYSFEDEIRTYRMSSLMSMMIRGKAGRKAEYMIGWGYRRYAEYLNAYRTAYMTEEITEEQRITREMAGNVLAGILDLFSYTSSCGVFMTHLTDWIERNISSGSMAYKEAYGPLCDLRDYFAFADIEADEAQVMNTLDKKISMLKKRDEAEGNSIVLRSLSHPSVLRRKHVYAIGMSASNMSGHTDESPVLSDNEMSVLLKKGYLPLIASEGIRRREEILTTFGSLEKGTLRISWPEYDTQDMNMRNPAVLALDLMSIAGIETCRGFAYGVPGHHINLPVPEYDLPAVTPASELLSEDNIFSATSLEKLADCPRAWYYDRICSMAEEKIPENTGYTWLDSRLRGNFIHAVFELYAKEVFGERQKENYPSDVDDEKLDAVIRKVQIKISAEVPETENWIMEREVNRIKSQCREYLQTVHHDYLSQGWEFLLAEAEFKTAQLNAGMKFNLTGKIDRVDCRIDEGKREIVLRTVDYKTGNPDRIRDKSLHGTALQMEVYTSALKTEEMQKMIRKKLSMRYGCSFDGWRISHDLFFYVFAMEEDSVLPVFAQDSFSLKRLEVMVNAVKHKGTFPDRFTIGEELEKNTEGNPSPEISKILDAVNGMPKKRGTGRKKTEEKCTYCDFAKLCDRALVK